MHAILPALRVYCRVSCDRSIDRSIDHNDGQKLKWAWFVVWLCEPPHFLHSSYGPVIHLTACTQEEVLIDEDNCIDGIRAQGTSQLTH